MEELGSRRIVSDESNRRYIVARASGVAFQPDYVAPLVKQEP